MVIVSSVKSAVVASCKVDSIIRRAIDHSYCKIMGDDIPDIVIVVPLDMQINDVGRREVNDSDGGAVNDI